MTGIAITAIICATLVLLCLIGRKDGKKMINRLLESSTLMILLLAAAVIVVSVLVLNCFQPTMDRIEWQEELYTVQRGDSLWAISGKYCPESVDRREWVDEIQVLNDIQGATIYPGQRLIVLAPVK